MRRYSALILLALLFAGCTKDPALRWDEDPSTENWLLGSWLVVESYYTPNGGNAKEKECPFHSLSFGKDGRGRQGNEAFTYKVGSGSFTIVQGSSSTTYDVVRMSAKHMEISWRASAGMWDAKLDKTSITR